MPLLEPVYQVAYLVEDLATSCAAWHQLCGAGPFFIMPHFAFLDPIYRGTAQGPDISIALGYSGGIMLELIVDHGPTASVFSEAPPAQGAPRFHHVACLTQDFDAVLAAHTPIFTARFPGDARACFLDTRATLGGFTEVIEATPGLVGMQQAMQAATAAWDGKSDLLRSF
jgi:hypothetical protein